MSESAASDVDRQFSYIKKRNARFLCSFTHILFNLVISIDLFSLCSRKKSSSSSFNRHNVESCSSFPSSHWLCVVIIDIIRALRASNVVVVLLSSLMWVLVFQALLCIISFYLISPSKPLRPHSRMLSFWSGGKASFFHSQFSLPSAYECEKQNKQWNHFSRGFRVHQQQMNEGASKYIL